MINNFFDVQSSLERQLTACVGAASACEAQLDWFSAADHKHKQLQAAHAIREQLTQLQLQQQRIQDIRDRVSS